MFLSKLTHARFRHLPALVLFLGIALFLFRLPLFEGYRFIGNPDRLSHYLSFAEFHSYNFAHARFSAWCEYLLTGFDSLALPFSFVSPLFVLPAALHTNDVVKVFGYVSPAILFATLTATYVVLYSLCQDRLAATAGAVIYGLSIWSLLKLTQNDNSYLAVFISPILFWLVHTTGRLNLGRRIAALTTIVWICIYWSFLNYFSYLPIFLATYGAYLWLRRNAAPILALSASLALGSVFSAPRLLVLLENVQGFTRRATGNTEAVNPVLFLRYLNGDIFGRSWRESMPTNEFNLSEGNLLFASIFASLLLLFIVARGHYRVRLGPAERQTEVRYGFFVAFILFVFVVIHSKRAYDLFALAFFRVSFLHTRFALAALFPIALVTTLYLTREPGWRFTPRRAGAVLPLTAAIVPIGAANFERLGTPLMRWLGHSQTTFVRVPSSIVAFVSVSETLRLIVLALIFGGLLLAARLHLLSGGTLRTLLAVVIISQATLSADHFLSGSHTRTYHMPFESKDPVMAGSREFRPPTREQLRQLQDVLENDRYRSILICPTELIPVDCTDAIGMFWRIRLADGYLSGLPRRYAALPWPASSVGLRWLHFYNLDGGRDQDDGAPFPWRLLSLLNVRNAIVLTKQFYTNDHFDPRRDLVLVHNPSPYVYPRVYFARRTRAVTRAEAAAAIQHDLGDCRHEPRTPCTDVLKSSLPVDYVEGPVSGDFDPGGSIQWHFDGDYVEIEFPPSPRNRLLVVNEAYNEHWIAEAGGRKLNIYPTNLVMRGIVVPEGATQVTLRYHSVIDVTWRYLAAALPFAIAAAYLLRRRLRELIDHLLGPGAPLE